MHPATTARHRGARIALAIGGSIVAIGAVAVLATFVMPTTFAPMVVCRRPGDVACSDDLLLGRDHAEHLRALAAVLVGLAGLLLIGTSGLWSRHVRRGRG